jgi:uncharacterized membrane protein YgcG
VGSVIRKIALVVAALVGAIMLLTAVPAAASPEIRTGVSNFEFESFDAEYLLSRDENGYAVMRVTETIVAIFPEYDQNRGIVRTIPKYYGPAPLYLSDFEVHDENGDPVPFETADVNTSGGEYSSTEYRAVELALGTDEFVHGRTTYVISYTAHNVVRHFDDSGNDELYWDINGDEWWQPFGRVSVSVAVDPAIADALTGERACYWGGYGDTNPCDIIVDAPGVLYAEVLELNRFETLTVAIEFEGATFVQPELPQDSWIMTLAPLWLLLGSGALLGMALVVRFGLWRDARGRGIVIPQYTPTEDRDFMIAADLTGRTTSAIAAQFVDLAVQGFVQVVDLYPKGTGAGVPNRFGLDFVHREGATSTETRFLKILFSNIQKPGERVRLGSIDSTKGAALHARIAKGRTEAIGAQLRAQPEGSLNVWLRSAAWFVLVGYIAIFIWSIAVDVDFGPVVLFLIGSIVLTLVTSGLLSKPYRLTDRGADARDYMLGIRDYLQLAEKDRIRVLQSPQGALRVTTTDKREVVKLHEKLLPYAVLWGIEKEWARELEVEYQSISEQPSWISTDLDSMDLGRMVSTFSQSSVSRVRPLVSTSSGSGGGSWSSGGSSSFSSGSSGGGFSGGGGGGGGGGGR